MAARGMWGAADLARHEMDPPFVPQLVPLAMRTQNCQDASEPIQGETGK